MSDHEQIAQTAQDKWATVSKLLRSLMTNERTLAIRSKKNCEKNLKSYYLVCFKYVFLFKKWPIRSSPLFGEQCEQIAQVAHQKWATMSNSH